MSTKQKTIEKTKAIEIIEFDNADPEHARAFYELNAKWIEKYFKIEDIDIKVLSNPQKSIIEKKGYILFAKINNKIVGTVALSPTKKDEYELHKFAVNENFQGYGAGKELIESILNIAKQHRAKNIYLSCNTMLHKALSIYRKFGFIDSYTPKNTKYKRCDISMELSL